MGFLRAVGVTQRFSISARSGGDAHWLTVLSDINLNVVKGQFVSIVGPSGSGKSTLLQILAGLIAPSEGEVFIEGRRVVSPPFEMIYVFQQYSKSIFPWKTVLQNILFGIDNRRRGERNRNRDRAIEFIERVGLKGFEDYYPWQLSGGMQQRVAIARALVCQPQVLLMDEPFSAIDALTRASLQDLLLQLWQELSLTVLFVTHDIDEAVYLSDTVLRLTRSPARIADSVSIELSYPRSQLSTREDPLYLSYRHRILERVFAEQKFAAP